jgi:serine/threonine protein kinase
MGRDQPREHDESSHDAPGRPGPASAAAPLPPALANNQEYEIVREISRGGMGVVYLARNRRMDRLEGLKVVNAALLERPGALERFEREMRAAARLSHPNIVTAFSAPTLDGLLAFAMEYVEGIDLHELVQRHGPLPVANACYYISQVAQGLQHACDQQMVHRDIKPGNLMLKRDGKKQTIKILDFGLAKATSEHVADGDLTGDGQILGTPQFIAPEQIRDARRADIRADIYSLGCTLYYLLAGNSPFGKRGNVYDILQAHQSDAPQPLDSRRGDIPPDLAAIVARMLAKDPAERFQRPGEVTRALAPYFKSGVKPLPTGDGQFPIPPSPDTANVRSEDPTHLPNLAAAAARPSASPVGPIGAAAHPWRSWRALVAVGAVLCIAGIAGWVGISNRNSMHESDQKTSDRGGARGRSDVADIDEPAVTAAMQGGLPGAGDSTERSGDSPRNDETVSGSASKAPVEPEQAVPADAATANEPPAAVAKSDPASDGTPDSTPQLATGGFFNGRDLTGWKGQDGVWTVVDGAIVGVLPPEAKAATFLYSEATYKDFELRFEVRRQNGIGRCGVQFRSRLAHSEKFLVAGPQIAIDSADATETPGTAQVLPEGKPIFPSDRDIVSRSWKDDEFNEMFLRCLGEHVTVKVNGAVVLDGDYPPLARDGIIAWHLSRVRPPERITFRNIEFSDLSRGDPPLPEVHATAGELPRSARLVDDFTDAMRRADNGLVSRFDKTLASLRRSPLSGEERKHLVDAVKAEKVAFEGHGQIPWSTPMRPAVLDYLREVMLARGRFQKGMDRLIAERVRTRDDSGASALQAEFAQVAQAKLLGEWHCAGSNAEFNLKLFSDGKFTAPTWFPNMPQARQLWMLASEGMTVTIANANLFGKTDIVNRCALSADGQKLLGVQNTDWRFKGTRVFPK